LELAVPFNEGIGVQKACSNTQVQMKSAALMIHAVPDWGNIRLM
jgi:hypothetical protein